jgi:predicted RND superfamily exporter protein
VIAFYSLANILIVPTFREAIGIGVVAGIICALISHSFFPPANLISEPIGAVVCPATYLALRNRFALRPGHDDAPRNLRERVLLHPHRDPCGRPTILSKYGTLEAFLAVTVPIVLITAAVNAVVGQVLVVPASRALMRGARQAVPARGARQVDES